MVSLLFFISSWSISLYALDRSLRGVRSRCSQFPQSLAGSWVIKRHLPTIIIDVIITHLVTSLTGLIIILMLTIVISPAESLIWGLPPCRQVFVTVCLFSCILLVVYKDSAVEFKGNCVWSWDRCCCVISFPI